MDISSTLSGSRRKRVIFGSGLAVGTGLIGLPLLLLAVWPWIDHAPYSASVMIGAFGFALTSLSYAFGKVALSGCTEGSRRPVEEPGRRPYVVAGVALAIAFVSLLVMLAT
ncbi:hypothetical protein F0L68_37805 [Solihabitans fulvus]|uniref:Uncharacterized protein n=1 Tax=Solihabitans fulvus TaxID=1892852 RepID=A0A5B2WJV3_9PSEU|nr:hypothetical protein [Solihabitans fulvus]KAA2251184.1 hypothetical protein F0L68_37805 [Solihabitans fulvus]